MLNKKKETLQKILDHAIDRKKIFGTSFSIKYKNDLWTGASGNLKMDSQYFIASTTKLFVTAIIFKFQSQGIISIEDKITDYLDEHTIRGLHVLDGKDYSKDLTIKNLLAHTSGIPDYFQHKNEAGSSIELELMKGNDMLWTFENIIEYSKKMKPYFVPNTKNKAHYSDTNFQLLGKIIENITDKSLSEIFERIVFQPFAMEKTYLYKDVADERPANLYFKEKELSIPKAMTSFGADGGAVSTSHEMLLFLEAFFNGAFFPNEYLKEMMVWNRLFIPVDSGVGIQRIKLPWFFNPAGTIPELYGHSGLSGTFAFCNPQKELYVSGTVNQIAKPGTSFRLAIKMINEILKN